MSTTVSSGTTYTVSSGTEIGDDVQNGGTIVVVSSGTIADTIVSSGGEAFVSSGGVASHTTLLSGGAHQVVFNAGTALNTVVNGLQLVSAGGVASSTSINSGGYDQVYGNDFNAIVNSGGEQDVFSGGTANGATLLTSATQSVFLGGTASGTLVSGGHQFVDGSATGTTVLFNEVFGVQTVNSGGSATFTSIGNGAFQTVNSGGSAISALVLSGGEQDVFGTASSTTLLTSGTQVVFSGGTASGVLVSGGHQDVYGSATNTNLVFNGVYALQIVKSGGSASLTTVGNGSFQTVDSGGSAISASVLSGGEQDVFGTASNTVISNGGTEYVFSGGTASGTVVLGGGTTVVSSGGTELSPVISGGKLELAAGAVLSGSVTFAGPSGTLQVDGAYLPTNTISAFVPGDDIDLAGVQFDSKGTVTLTSGNVLQISENSHVYRLQLDPSANFYGEKFVLSSDGHGGSDLSVESNSSTHCPGPNFDGWRVSTLDQLTNFFGTVAGMFAHDAIDFWGNNFATGHQPSYSGPNSGDMHSSNFALLGNYIASTFVTSSIGHGGTTTFDPLLASSHQQVLAHPQHT